MAPVVLVHGLAGSARWWRAVRERFDEPHVVDVPRVHPHEAPAWLLGRLDQLGVERVDLIGHSLGGLICARVAAAAPERVRRLVLLAPAGIPTGRSLLGHVWPLVAAVADAPTMIPRLTIDALRTGPVLIRSGLYAATHDLRDEVAHVRVPTLVVWGQRDRLLPRELADEWARLLPDARVETVAAGHVPMWDAPDELAAAVLDFLQKTPDEVGHEPRPRVVDGVRFPPDDAEAPER